MKVYATLDPRLELAGVAAQARRVERLGFDGLFVAETVNDALAVAALALEHTGRLTVRTSVVVAFARSPLQVAYSSWALSSSFGGRFELGLGTQVRQNIEQRYGMVFGDPVAHLGEYLDVLDQAFAAFSTGARPSLRGDYYRFTRLQDYFNPGPDAAVRVPPVHLGGVNAGACALAGARAAGFVTHPTNSNERYLAELCLPAIRAGASAAGRDLDGFELVVGGSVVVGRDAADLEHKRDAQRRLFAFLYSTPAYRRTLELYGFEEVGERLRAMVASGDDTAVDEVVTDELLTTLVPHATYDELAPVLAGRFAHLAQAVVVPVGPGPGDPHDDEALGRAVAELQAVVANPFS